MVIHVFLSNYYILPFSPIDPSAAWTKINRGQKMYYRVNYPLEDWASFAENLMADVDVLPTTDRTGLLTDAFSLAGGLRLPFDVALDLTKFLEKDRALVTWEAATGVQTNVINLGYVSLIYYDQPDFNSLTAYHRSLVNTVHSEVGWTVSPE